MDGGELELGMSDTLLLHKYPQEGTLIKSPIANGASCFYYTFPGDLNRRPPNEHFATKLAVEPFYY